MDLFSIFYNVSLLITCLVHISSFSVAAQKEKLEVEEPRLEGEDRHIGHGRHQSGGHHRARVRYSSSYRVPPQLLQRKGGIDLANKTHLIETDSVLIIYQLRRLIYNRSTENLAVCAGPATGPSLSSNRTQSFNYFACQQKLETCCDKETFYRTYGHPVPPSMVVIGVSAAAGMIVLALLTAVLFCIKRPIRRDSTVSKVNKKAAKSDFAGTPLILTAGPLTDSLGSVYATSQQCPAD
uniref:Protein shisa-6-like n=1 Tax=Macrostomum lignano TaxID=282301 RepID=A0A1I8FSN7_9PLAT